jgi:erythromycin esterase-like protein
MIKPVIYLSDLKHLNKHCSMKNILFPFIILLTINSFSQEYIDRYNFGFEKDINFTNNNWNIIAESNNMQYDTIDYVEGKRSVVFDRSPMRCTLYLCLYQEILLPCKSEKISVSVFAKSLNNQNTWLKVSGFNVSGENVSTDSVSIIGENGWQKFTANIQHEDIYLLKLEIRKEDTFTNKDIKLWLDNVSVTCDGENLLSIDRPTNGLSKQATDDIRRNIPLDGDMVLPDSVLTEIASKKIIGFGETTHWSKEANKCVYNNIKQLILEHNCRLVLLEKPVDVVALYNLYAHGFTIDSTVACFKPPYKIIDTITYKLLFDSPEVERFVNWVKVYNEGHKEKVMIMGVSEHANPSSSNCFPPELNLFISSMKLNSSTIDSLVILINTCKERSLPLEFAIKNEKELQSLMGNFNSMVLMQILRSRTDALYPYKYINSYEWRQVHSDYLMWQNAKMAMDSFSNENSVVAIYMHYGHLCKAPFTYSNEAVPVGRYLSQAYGDGYYHIGLIMGQGFTGAMVWEGWKWKEMLQALQEPVIGSVEYLAMQSGVDNFFKKGFVKYETPLVIRESGLQHMPLQFRNKCCFPGYMDGFIFIKNSTSVF